MFKLVLVIALLAFTPSDALLKKSHIKKIVGGLVSPPKLPGIPFLGNLLPTFGAVIGGVPGSAVVGDGSGAAVEIELPEVEPVLEPLPEIESVVEVEQTPVTQEVEEITPVQRIIKTYSGPQYYSYVPVNSYAIRNSYALPNAYSVPYPYSYTYSNSIPRNLYQARSGWQ